MIRRFALIYPALGALAMIAHLLNPGHGSGTFGILITAVLLAPVSALIARTGNRVIEVGGAVSAQVLAHTSLGLLGSVALSPSLGGSTHSAHTVDVAFERELLGAASHHAAGHDAALGLSLPMLAAHALAAAILMTILRRVDDFLEYVAQKVVRLTHVLVVTLTAPRYRPAVFAQVVRVNSRLSVRGVLSLRGPPVSLCF